jgi:hypothetical protein
MQQPQKLPFDGVLYHPPPPRVFRLAEVAALPRRMELPAQKEPWECQTKEYEFNMFEFIGFEQYEFIPTCLNSYVLETYEFNMLEFIRFKQYKFILTCLNSYILKSMNSYRLPP